MDSLRKMIIDMSALTPENNTNLDVIHPCGIAMVISYVEQINIVMGGLVTSHLTTASLEWLLDTPVSSTVCASLVHRRTRI